MPSAARAAYRPAHAARCSHPAPAPRRRPRRRTPPRRGVRVAPHARAAAGPLCLTRAAPADDRTLDDADRVGEALQDLGAEVTEAEGTATREEPRHDAPVEDLPGLSRVAEPARGHHRGAEVAAARAPHDLADVPAPPRFPPDRVACLPVSSLFILARALRCISTMTCLRPQPVPSPLLAHTSTRLDRDPGLRPVCPSPAKQALFYWP